MTSDRLTPKQHELMRQIRDAEPRCTLHNTHPRTWFSLLKKHLVVEDRCYVFLTQHGHDVLEAEEAKP